MLTVVIGVFVYLTGLCVGSFLNVVVYRLPRGLSISKPTWSFCPLCGATLRWYDNLPVLSWLLLRARCRDCRQPISVQYPLIEAVTGLAFVLAHHLLFVADGQVLAVAADRVTPLGATWPTDVPLLLAWLVLAAVLVACAAMDLLWYVVDTRITGVALMTGIVLHALWPRPEFFAARAATPAAAAAFAALVVSGLMLWRTTRRDASDDEQQDETETTETTTDAASVSPSDNVATVVAVVAFVGLAVWLLVAAAYPAARGGGVCQAAVPAAFVALFAAMVLAAVQPRQVDEDLRAAIEGEAPAARRLAATELLWLAPAIGAAVTTFFVVRNVPTVADVWSGVTNWAPIGRFTPLGGIAFAVHGAIIAAAAGWIVRIFFTLAFGREAFGVGDIHILAAAGAVGGWDIALLGFLLSIFIALAGWILGLVLKRTGMIPFGPALALGFLAALWLNRPAAARVNPFYEDLTAAWRERPELVLLLVGMVAVLLPLSIMLAKLTRRLVEPPPEPPETAPNEGVELSDTPEEKEPNQASAHTPGADGSVSKTPPAPGAPTDS